MYAQKWPHEKEKKNETVNPWDLEQKNKCNIDNQLPRTCDQWTLQYFSKRDYLKTVL